MFTHQTFILSQFWRLKVPDQGLTELFVGKSLPGVQMPPFYGVFTWKGESSLIESDTAVSLGTRDPTYGGGHINVSL